MNVVHEQVDVAVHALRGNGFNVRPWHLASEIEAILGGPHRDMRMFDNGTVHGLLEITPDAMNVVALGNRRPGNGQFKRVVGKMERCCDSLGLTLRVVEFHNERLCAWFSRRGYSIGRRLHWGLYAEREVPRGVVATAVE